MWDSDYTGRTYEPLALQVGPETLYIITSPQDVAQVYKRADVLIWEGHLNQIFLNFGFNAESLKLAWLKPVDGDSRYIHNNPVNPKQLSLIHLIENIYAKQLLPGVQMDIMSQAFMKSLQSTLCWPTLDFCAVKANGGTNTISLKTLCQHSLLEAGIYSFFGSMIGQIDSKFIQNMLAFNENAWMLFYGLPPMFSSAVSTPQRALKKTLQKFASSPESLRDDQSWGVRQILTAQEIVGIDLESRACMLLMVLWAWVGIHRSTSSKADSLRANSNVNNISFWVLAHIVTDERLRDAVKKEVNAAWNSEQLDIKFLCANAPVLDDTFHECLRLKAGAMMGRKVQEPTLIGNKWLKPGASILIPSRQLHSNENVWGANHKSFDANRFADNKGLLKHSSYRPFGGGVSYCPGRKIAREQVFALVAILFHRFDVVVSKEMPTEFPRLDVSTPALGVTGPAKGMDIFLDLSPGAKHDWWTSREGNTVSVIGSKGVKRFYD